jgi:hypothetical protein
VSDDQRLYGLPEAERLHFEIAEVWETDIEPYLDSFTRTDWWVVEEWTVCDPRSHLPSAERVVDYILEQLEELDEYCYEAFDNASSKAEMEVVLAAWASRVTYRMAQSHVATHRITLVDVPDEAEPQPFLNGEPLYVASETPTSDRDQP